MTRNRWNSRWQLTALLGVAFVGGVLISAKTLTAAENDAAEKHSAEVVARQVDQLLEKAWKQADVQPSPLINDEDFLRRVSFDLAGTAPTPSQVTLFGLNPDPHKREKLIDRLLASEDHALNWGRYWRDVVFSRATNMRAQLARGAFEKWMTEQIRENRPWHEVATEMVTATGNVTENGATGLLFAHDADGSEVASEVSRIFLGIQIQCANCHDHPTDQWKREQFHELAAYFPRIRIRAIRDGQRLRGFEVASVTPNSRQSRGLQFLDDPARAFRFLDRNRDGKLSKTEIARTPFARVFDRLAERADSDKDGQLSLAEIKAIPKPPQQYRGQAEHYMPNLDDPGSRGELMQPVFFVNGDKAQAGLDDISRRTEFAKIFTAKDNPWFARAIVNRMWAELLGKGFYQPIDDMGPERTAAHPEVMAALCEGFVANGHDVRWLFRTIALTQAYQRALPSPGSASTADFACATPTRLRSDQLYTAITKVFGVTESRQYSAQRGGGGLYNRNRGPRSTFNQLFGFDPSTPQSDLTNTIPQSLFMMNSTQINGLIRASANSRLGRILSTFKNEDDAINELYLMVLSRSASERELAICREYIEDVNDRAEAYEDLLWSLLNSTEFLTKR